MSSIDEYFGFNEPPKKIEEKVEEKEKSLSERSLSLSEGLLSLDKTSEYFEETYKKVEGVELTEDIIAPAPVQSVVSSYADSLANLNARMEFQDDVVEEDANIKLHKLDQRITALSSTIDSVKGAVIDQGHLIEGTLVSGIGQGGDGQLPGGGEVLINRMDDVDGMPTDGQVLVWNEDEQKYKPASVSGVGGDVTSIVAGDGIEVNPANGKGDVTVSLDSTKLAIDTSGATQNDVLSFDGTNFVPSTIDTSNVNLATPGDVTTYSGTLPVQTLNTQEDVNIYSIGAISDLSDRVTDIENNGGGGGNNGGGGSGGGLTQVDLEYKEYADRGVIENTGGEDATIPLADTTNAGLFDPADKIKLDGIDLDEYYTKTEVDLAIADFITEDEVDIKLGNYYTKTEVDGLVGGGGGGSGGGVAPEATFCEISLLGTLPDDNTDGSPLQEGQIIFSLATSHLYVYVGGAWLQVK